MKIWARITYCVGKIIDNVASRRIICCISAGSVFAPRREESIQRHRLLQKCIQPTSVWVSEVAGMNHPFKVLISFQFRADVIQRVGGYWCKGKRQDIWNSERAFLMTLSGCLEASTDSFISSSPHWTSWDGKHCSCIKLRLSLEEAYQPTILKYQVFSTFLRTTSCLYAIVIWDRKEYQTEHRGGHPILLRKS